MSNTPEFRVWTDMHTRCYNAKFKDYRYYGGKGITVCERWHSFENFFADMGARPGARHSIDRIDSAGPYSPENCRWATPLEQSNNKSNTVRVAIGGITKPLAEWCAERGVERKTAWLRYQQGLRGEALFETTCERLTYNGVTDTVAGWARRTGLKPTTIAMRIARKWPSARILTEGAKSCA